MTTKVWPYRGQGLPYGRCGLPSDEDFIKVSEAIEDQPKGKVFNAIDIVNLVGEHLVPNLYDITGILGGYVSSQFSREDGFHLQRMDDYTGFLWK